ncbi:hypothetical protein GEV33_005366 [Tenebrio molitor]|uniref:Uncharacterized protein n=1 Tax=Tenebrio molitor TaxID=7067 RepID=A0A8J6HMP6_TENMO|nr:hypothetical protein GEV33_005366 [Tenebrio molitor]
MYTNTLIPFGDVRHRTFQEWNRIWSTHANSESANQSRRTAGRKSWDRLARPPGPKN